MSIINATKKGNLNLQCIYRCSVKTQWRPVTENKRLQYRTRRPTGACKIAFSFFWGGGDILNHERFEIHATLLMKVQVF